MIELNLELAERALKAAQAKAKELGTPMTVTLVDESARLVLSARGDGTNPLSPETSRAKAVASVIFRRTTKAMAELYKTNPDFWASVPIVLQGQVLPSAGAVPIIQKGKVIGAIGCGGGTGEQDHQCAEAGAATITS